MGEARNNSSAPVQSSTGLFLRVGGNLIFQLPKSSVSICKAQNPRVVGHVHGSGGSAAVEYPQEHKKVFILPNLLL